MCVILLTSTIKTLPGLPASVRNDPAQRLQDYVDALKFYLGLIDSCIDAIVFVDNSQSDLAPLKRLVDRRLHDRVEFISTDGMDFPPEYGKAYGEFKDLDHVMQNSEIIGNMQPGDKIWKITGRFMVTNLCQLIDRAPASYDIYCDLKNYPVKWVNLRLISWTPAGYRAVLHNIYPHLRVDVIKGPGGFYVQNAIREACDRMNIVPQFTVQPFVSGIGGSSNKDDTPHGFGLCKHYIQSLLRRLMPSFRI